MFSALGQYREASTVAVAGIRLQSIHCLPKPNNAVIYQEFKRSSDNCRSCHAEQKNSTTTVALDAARRGQSKFLIKLTEIIIRTKNIYYCMHIFCIVALHIYILMHLERSLAPY